MAVQKKNVNTGNPRRSAAAKVPPAKKGKTSKTPWGIIFWAAFFIVIFSLFVINRDNIVRTLEDTHFFERIMNRKVSGIENIENNDPVPPEPVELPVSPGPADSPPDVTDKESGEETKIEITAAESPPENEKLSASPETSRNVPKAEEAAPARERPEAQSPASTPAPAREPQTPARDGPPAAPPAPPPASKEETGTLRERGLYFTHIDSGGATLRVKVTRSLPASDSPMLDALNSLIAGPNREEQNRGLISLIPRSSRVLSATVRGSTAYISFSEEFQYNPYGVEGYAASLRQIIWTATEFSNIKDVQILIEGRRVDYLGEGIWIGSPVNRTF